MVSPPTWHCTVRPASDGGVGSRATRGITVRISNTRPKLRRFCSAGFLRLRVAAIVGSSLVACGGNSKNPVSSSASGGYTAAGGAESHNGGSGAGVASASSGGTKSDAISAGSGGTRASLASAGSNQGGAASSVGGASATGVGGAPASGGTTACPSLPAAPIPASAITQFNDNGGWNWFQDERAVVDRAKNKFVIGSIASGGARDGNVEAVVYDVPTGTKQLFTIGTGLKAYVDDYNAPAFLVRPDGKYFAMWAGHRLDCNSRTSIFDGAAWSAETLFSWTSLGCPWLNQDSNRVTYANPWYIGGSIFAGVRSVDTAPAFLTSSDDGATLSYYGRLIANQQAGFVAGYYKYWGNNNDRIDFVGTEGHPRDVDSSLWHGYLKGGKLFDSLGAVVDDNGGDNDAQPLQRFTSVVKTGITLGNVTLNHLWNHDIARYADGTIAVLGQGRTMGSRSDDPDLRLIYARFDGTSWRATYLGKAGHKLTVDDQDFTGLGALHPDNPNIIFISTNVDPRDDTTILPKHELFEGVTCNGGTTWSWAPLTQDSKLDNLRPIVPKWDSNHTLLLWLSGNYITAQRFDLAVVGSTAL